MPKPCPACQKDIAPGNEVVSVIGGFFDKEDPEFFVQDEDVMGEAYIHKICLVEMVLAKSKGNVA